MPMKVSDGRVVVAVVLLAAATVLICGCSRTPSPSKVCGHFLSLFEKERGHPPDETSQKGCEGVHAKRQAEDKDRWGCEAACTLAARDSATATACQEICWPPKVATATPTKKATPTAGATPPPAGSGEDELLHQMMADGGTP